MSSTIYLHDIAAATAPPPPPDADLIAVCTSFAKAEFEDWYAYCTAPEGEEDNDRKPDFETLEWIAETPASTFEGLQAKVLACSAWHRSECDNEVGDTPLLASLLHDMAAAPRHAIPTDLQVKYGPLYERYTPDWRFAGEQTA